MEHDAHTEPTDVERMTTAVRGTIDRALATPENRRRVAIGACVAATFTIMLVIASVSGDPTRADAASGTPAAPTASSVASLMAGAASDGGDVLGAFAPTSDTAEDVAEEGLEGPEGLAGADGEEGPEGLAGADGEEGPAGTDGADGMDGLGLRKASDPVGLAITSPDGESYQLVVTDRGILLKGPHGTQSWDGSATVFATSTAEVPR